MQLCLWHSPKYNIQRRPCQRLTAVHHLGDSALLWSYSGQSAPRPRRQLTRLGGRRALVVSNVSLYTRLTGNDEEEARDDFKEESRKYKRTVFTFNRWASHRSTSRYYRHVLGLFSSRIVRGLASPLLVITIISFAVASYESLREEGILPGSLPGVTFSVTGDIFNLSSFALSLLLVFRTNASYDRWLEARHIWGGIINRSRDLVRQGLTWFKPEEAELLELLRRWTIAFSRSAMCHLREDSNLEKELEHVLKPDELELLLRAEHRPNLVLHVLGEIVRQAKLPDSEIHRMDETVTFFADSIGGCERLLTTPIPLSYTRHTSRFLVLWLIFLPFTLWEGCRWAIVPGCAVIAFLLLGIEEIGVSIEEPMSILPLENFCTRAEENIAELIFQSNDVKAMAANWSIGQSSPPQPPFPAFVDGNGNISRSYLANNEKAKEAISKSGKRNAIRGWPPSGPLSQ